MIKLGLFDLDGTLLTSEGRLPETFYEDVELLRSRGVSIAIASARPAQFLFEMFDRDVDLFISGEDGNIFFRGKQFLHARYVSAELIARVYAIATERDDIAVICTGPDNTYVSAENYRRFFLWGVGRFMPDTPVDLPEDAKICKIHVFCRDGVEAAKRMASTVFAEFTDFSDVQESGYGWIGIMEKDSNKAAAVRFFQEYLNVGNDETAVFGDNTNDIPMFELTENSYAMKNAAVDIQSKAKHVTEEDNDHNGAMKTLLSITS
jgi:hypothetical protein